MTKQFIPLSHDTPAEILVATQGPEGADVPYIRFDKIEYILRVVEMKWGKEYPGARIGIAAHNAIQILNEIDGPNGPAAKGKP